MESESILWSAARVGWAKTKLFPFSISSALCMTKDRNRPRSFPITRIMKNDVHSDSSSTRKLPMSSPFQWDMHRSGPTTGLLEEQTIDNNQVINAKSNVSIRGRATVGI